MFLCGLESVGIIQFLEDLGIAVTKRVRRNEEIDATEVRVIDSQGEQAGVMSLRSRSIASVLSTLIP